MQCPRCQTENRGGRRFCADCGAALPAACPSCGFANIEGDRFCGGCGDPLPEGKVGGAAPRAGAGERRQVTVLFADVVGFTSLSETLDPEAVHELMGGCCAHLSREVDRYGGMLTAFTGDGVMALFGAPLAEEDHAARAVHSALAIQNALTGFAEEVQQRFGVEFRMRIGVNTGLVLVGGLEEGEAAQYTALGDAVNLASRLESAAPPGGVLAGEMTWRAAGDAFRWQAVEPLHVKGKTEPVNAWEPVAVSDVQSRFDALAQRGLTAFVGRQAQLDELIAAWAEASGGAGRIVSVVGEAGLGKSRLIHEFKTELAKRDATVVEGSCFTYGDRISYLPFLQIIRRIVGVDEGALPGDIAGAFDKHLNQAGLTSSAPYLRQLFGLDPVDDTLARQSPATIRQRTRDAVAGLVLAAAEGALAVIVEDVHWIDSASEEVLSAVVEAMADKALLVVLAYRPEYLHAWGELGHHSELSMGRLGGAGSAAMVRAILGKSYASQLPLSALSVENSRGMVRHLLGGLDVPADLDELIDTYTDGNPLFIEELVRHLVEVGHLLVRDDGFVFDRPEEMKSLPTTLEGVLLARIDRLDPELRALLQSASVLGRVFPHELLGAVTGWPDGLDRALLELEDRDFVYQSGLAPDRRYSFKHVLTQEAVYQTLLSARRRADHEQAGRAIEALYHGRLDEWVEILVHHYSRSGNDDKALDYLAAAHRKAARTSAVLEADAFFQQAMAVLDRSAPTPGADRRRISFLVNQFLVAFLLNKTRSYVGFVEQYADVAERLDDPVLRRWMDLRGAQCAWCFGVLDEAIPGLQAVADGWEADGNLEGAANTYSWLMWAHLMRGNYDDVLALEPRALEVFERHFDALHYMWTRTAAAWALVHRGAWTKAIAECEAGLRVGEADGNNSLICFSAFSLCKAYTGKGQMDEALRYGELGLGRAPTPAEQLWTLTAMAQTWCRVGRSEEAVAALTMADPRYEGAEFLMASMWNRTVLGEAFMRAGRLAEATAALESVIERAGAAGMRFYVGSSLRLLGETLRRTGSDVDLRRRAGDAFEHAIDVLAAIGADNELAHAHAGYGRLHRDSGDAELARQQWCQALDLFERLGTQGEPDEIRTELAELRVS